MGDIGDGVALVPLYWGINGYTDDIWLSSIMIMRIVKGGTRGIMGTLFPLSPSVPLYFDPSLIVKYVFFSNFDHIFMK